MFRDKGLAKFPMFQVKSSKAFDNIQIKRISINQMMIDEPVRRRAYEEVQHQIDKIIEHLEG